jgi:hypothetical protein
MLALRMSIVLEIKMVTAAPAVWYEDKSKDIGMREKHGFLECISYKY